MADAALSVTLGADITNFSRNLTTAVSEVNRANVSIVAATASITASINRINAINTAGLVSSITAATSATNQFGTDMSRVSASVSRNVAAFNPAPIRSYVAGLSSAESVATSLSASTSTLTSNISRNVSAFNGLNISSFNRSLQDGTVSLRTISAASSTTSQSLAATAAASASAAGGTQAFSRSLSQLEADLRALRSSLAAATDPATITRLNQEITRTQQGIQQINRFASTGSLTPLTAGANQASFALTNLGRVAQDAPFGFIGIQNNLNPLLESFQRLRAETGSNAAAMRALGQSLLGAGGIGLALSVVTSAITIYTMWQQKSNKAHKEAKTDTDAYIKSLDQLTQSKLRGNQNAQKEITDLSTMYAISQNTTLAYKTRKEAVDQLQKQYPDYFKNIKDETILNGGAKTAYDNLTTSILATARARAAQDQITKNASKILENEQKLLDNEAKIKNNAIAKEKELTALKERTKNLPGSEAVVSQRQELENRALKANITLTEYQRKRQEEISILTARNKNLAKSVMDEVKGGADVIGSFGTEADKTGNKLKTLPEIMKELSASLLLNENQFKQTFGENNEGKISAYQSAIESLIANGFNPASDAVINLKKQQQDLFQLAELNKFVSATTGIRSPGLDQKGKPKDIAITGKVKVGGVMDSLDQSSQELMLQYVTILAEQDKFTKEFNEGFAQLGSSAVVEGLSSGFSAIGEAIASGGSVIEALGQSLIGTIGDVLSELGMMLIKKGASAIAAGIALNLILPGSGAKSIAGGIGLIAAGGALSLGAGMISGANRNSSSSTITKPTAFANGGIVYGPTLGLMGEYSGASNNPEVIAPLNKLKGLIGDNTPQFEVIQYIDNNKLAVMVRNANEKLSRQ